MGALLAVWGQIATAGGDSGSNSGGDSFLVWNNLHGDDEFSLAAKLDVQALLDDRSSETCVVCCGNDKTCKSKIEVSNSKRYYV